MSRHCVQIAGLGEFWSGDFPIVLGAAVLEKQPVAVMVIDQDRSVLMGYGTLCEFINKLTAVRTAIEQERIQSIPVISVIPSKESVH